MASEDEAGVYGRGVSRVPWRQHAPVLSQSPWGPQKLTEMRVEVAYSLLLATSKMES